MRSFLASVLGGILGLALSLLLCLFTGENPLHVLQILYSSSFGSGYDFGMTLFYTAPLILTGLAVAIPFRAGLFNIGAEGQLTMGALAASSAAILAPHLHSHWIAILFAGVLAFLGGALWGALPGYLKARRGSHEVITTIMLNFVAAGVSSYLTLYPLKDPSTSQAETLLLPGVYYLKSFKIFDGAPMGWMIFVLIALVFVLQYFLKNSSWGYELNAVGKNEIAAQTYGISKASVWIRSMFLGGGLAGCVGILEVLGNSHRFKVGFSADYGFIGIAVALAARGNVLGVLPAAFIFGVLQKGSASLDLETETITRDLSYLIQGLVILGVSAEGLWDRFVRKEKRYV